MTGIKAARIMLCSKCEFNRNTGAWPWPRCCYVEAERTGLGAPDRDNAFMEGEEGNCLAGYWTGLIPVDLEAEARLRKEQALNMQREHIKPVILNALRQRTQEDVDNILSLLSTLHAIQPEIAVEISDELESA